MNHWITKVFVEEPQICLKNVYQGTHIALDRSTSKYMKVCKSGSNNIKVHYILGATPLLRKYFFEWEN